MDLRIRVAGKLQGIVLSGKHLERFAHLFDSGGPGQSEHLKIVRLLHRLEFRIQSPDIDLDHRRKLLRGGLELHQSKDVSYPEGSHSDIERNADQGAQRLDALASVGPADQGNLL